MITMKKKEKKKKKRKKIWLVGWFLNVFVNN